MQTRIRTRSWIRLMLTALLGMLVLSSVSVAHAADAVVVEANDVAMLVGAITAANASSALTVIVLTANDYDVTSMYLRTETGLPMITGKVTIQGNGAIIQRSATGVIDNFRLFAVAPGGELHLDRVIVGNAISTGGGAGVDNAGTLTLTNSAVSNNSTINGGGAGIRNFGSATLIDSTVSGNSSAWDGGGILNVGTLTLTNSTVGDNKSRFHGGGLYSVGTATLINSTVGGNSTSMGSGGGVFNTADAVLMLANSTLSDNAATWGGGLYNADTATLALSNSLVAENRASSGGPDALGNVAIDGGHNLIGEGTDMTGLTNGDNGNQVGDSDDPIDPQLGPLQDNGGPTETMALSSTSPAIDAIPMGTNGCGDNINSDQRGVERPQGDGCDVGAFEVEIEMRPSDPASISACKRSGWQEFGFRNQGQCIKFVNTGKDSR